MEVDRTPGPVVTDPLNDQPIVEIAWAAEDALRFPVCLSSITDAAHGARMVEEISVALGNVILVDHGLTIEGEPLGAVPQPVVFLAPAARGIALPTRRADGRAPALHAHLERAPADPCRALRSGRDVRGRQPELARRVGAARHRADRCAGRQPVALDPCATC